MDNQLEKFSPLLNNLTGLTKVVAKRILNGDFVEALDKIMSSSGTEDKVNASKDLIRIAVRKVTDAIKRKIAVIITVITGVLGIIITLVTLAAGGNVIIPLAIFAVIIVLTWIITGNVFNGIANKITDKLFASVKTMVFKDS
jgi:hypothetical protein